LLNAGIDVYSTVNVQHLESLNDLVARITGVVVRERVPDRLLEEANAVVVVDVTPETLEERLLEGKVYAPEKVDQALTNFFQRRNLIALRELALREVADSIEEEVEEISTTKSPICNIHERVLVCISTYPNSLQLIRRGGRFASYFNAKLYCLFVENPDRFLTKSETLHLETCEKLSQDFGGEFIRVKGHNVAQTIAAVAKTQRITQIVIGWSQNQSRWKLLCRGTLIQQLMDLLDHVDLHVIETIQSGKGSDQADVKIY
jgi:two-component system sensor histidine kinase KdpD